MQETKTTKEQIKVNVIGQADLNALTESEQKVFFSTLLKRITELQRKGGDEK